MSLGNLAPRGRRPKIKRCQRCKLCYEMRFDQCTHCGDLDEHGLMELMQRHKNEQDGNANLGWGLLASAAALVTVIILLALNA